MFVEKHSLHQNLLQTFLIFQKIGINTTVEITNRKINTHYNEGLKSPKNFWRYVKMEKNTNETIENSEENAVVENETQETPDTTVVNNVYLVKTVDDVAAARKSLITGASYVLGASLMTAALSAVTFVTKKIKSRIKKHKEAKKRDAEFEEEIDEDECDDQD